MANYLTIAETYPNTNEAIQRAASMGRAKVKLSNPQVRSTFSQISQGKTPSRGSLAQTIRNGLNKLDSGKIQGVLQRFFRVLPPKGDSAGAKITRWVLKFFSFLILWVVALAAIAVWGGIQGLIIGMVGGFILSFLIGVVSMGTWVAVGGFIGLISVFMASLDELSDKARRWAQQTVWASAKKQPKKPIPASLKSKSIHKLSEFAGKVLTSAKGREAAKIGAQKLLGKRKAVTAQDRLRLYAEMFD